MVKDETERERCAFCRKPIEDGGRVWTLWHSTMGRREQIAVHEECIYRRYEPKTAETVCGFLEALGFEIGVPN